MPTECLPVCHINCVMSNADMDVCAPNCSISCAIEDLSNSNGTTDALVTEFATECLNSCYDFCDANGSSERCKSLCDYNCKDFSVAMINVIYALTNDYDFDFEPSATSKTTALGCIDTCMTNY